MNVHTSPKRVLCSTILTWEFFSLFKSFKSYGSLNVIIRVWIIKILSNFKQKYLGNQKSEVDEPTYHWKENFMFYKLDLGPFLRILKDSKVMAF